MEDQYFNVASLITQVQVNGPFVTFYLNTPDSSVAARLRKALLNYIKTFAPHKITIDSPYHDINDTLLATLFARLAINNNGLSTDYTVTYQTLFGVEGPGVFSTLDINAPWLHVAQIYPLTEGQKISGKLTVAASTSAYHPKHQAFYNVFFQAKDSGFFFECEMSGIAGWDRISPQINQAYQDEINNPNRSVYTYIE